MTQSHDVYVKVGTADPASSERVTVSLGCQPFTAFTGAVSVGSFAVGEGREKPVAAALATMMLLDGTADEPHDLSHKSSGTDGTP